MMKKTIKSVLAVLLILCMLFSVVGCNDTGTTSDEQQVAAGDDFFTDQETENKTDADVNSDSDVTSNVNSNTQSNSKGDTNPNKVTTSVLPDENKVGGKTWAQVLASMPQKLRGTKIVMYNWNPASEYTGAPEVIDRFTKQTGIKVEWKSITHSTYFTKLPALIASGENIPDVVRTRGPVPSFMQNLQPLSTTGYDFSDEAWDQSMMDMYSVGDNVYATSLQNTHIGSVNILMYNKSLIEKYDFEDPYKLWKAGKWDWDKYLEMCREYQDLSSGENAGSCGEGHFGNYITCFGLQGAIAYNSKKDTFYNAMGENKFVTVHEKLARLYNDERVFAFGGASNFNDGKVLFSIGTAVHLRKKNSYFGNLKNSNKLMAVPMPSTGKTYYQGYYEAEAYGIANGASNPTAVPYFLRYFLDGANYELSTYFGNEQNLEVYNWCMNQKNKVYSYGYPEVMQGTSSEDSIEIRNEGQIKNYITAHNGAVEKTVKEYNEILAKLK